MPNSSQSESRASLRLATLNVLNNSSRLEERYELLALTLDALDIDTILLQEVLEPGLLKSILHRKGYTSWAHAERYVSPDDPMQNPISDSVAAASRIPMREARSIDLGAGARPGLHVEVLAGKRKVHFLTAHFSWGSHAEAERLEQAVALTREADSIMAVEPYSLVLLGGDLNTDDESRTSRYLKGMDFDRDGKSTYWTDAYDVAGTPDNWATTDQGKGMWGPITAAGSDITLPHLLPPRRIDRLMSFGWRYGKVGSPLSYERFGMGEEGELDISDHYGIVSDFLL